jgi:hypothetical protein
MAASGLLLIEKPIALAPSPLVATGLAPPVPIPLNEKQLAPRIVQPDLGTGDMFLPKAPKQSVFARWAGRLRSV